ncbi:unnamed protein product, partial [Heterotrigona itama]
YIFIICSKCTMTFNHLIDYPATKNIIEKRKKASHSSVTVRKSRFKSL